MIAGSDRVVLPDGVSVHAGQVEDTVRGCRWPLNDTGGFVLLRAGAQLDEVVRELAERYGITPDVARRDVLQFVWTLNALAVINIAHRGSRLGRGKEWLLLAGRLIPAATLPVPLTRRRALDTRTVPRAAASAFLAAGPRVLTISCAALVALLPLSVGLGAGSAVFVALGLGAGTGVGVGLHEAGHAVTLRGIPSALVLRGRRTFVLHAPLGDARRSLVALAGPAITVVLGLALIAAGSLLVSPALVILGLPLIAHAVSLSVLGGDGRSACGI